MKKIKVSELGSVELLKVDLELDILNRLRKIHNTQEALGFFSIFQFIVIFTYIVTRGF